MPDSVRLGVKICGVQRAEDARTAVDAGADYVGAILSPGFARSVSPEIARSFVPAGEAILVAVLVDAGVRGAALAAGQAAAGVIQLHGSEEPGDVMALRNEGDWPIWKAVRVRHELDVTEAIARWGGVADGLLLDGYREGAIGGAGVRFPWSALEKVRDSVPSELTLVVAGGLDAGNVAEVVERLSPDVVDVSSGVETRPGAKDPMLVREFVRAALLAAPRRPTRPRGVIG